MVAELRLANEHNTKEADLLSGDIRYQHWQVGTATVNMDYTHHVPYGAMATFKNFGLVREQISLLGEGSSGSLVAGLHNIEDLLETGRLYFESEVHADPIWLYWKHKDGLTSRRSLIFRGKLGYSTAVGVNAFLNKGVVLARLDLTRHPMWELPWSVGGGNTIANCNGGLSNPTLTPTGTAPGRVGLLQITPQAMITSPLSDVWVGIKGTYFPNSGDSYKPRWELEDGTLFNSSTVLSDSGASGGAYVQSAFGVNSGMIKRVGVRVQQVEASTSNYDNYIGNYLVLLRCRLNSGNTVAMVRLYSGFNGSDSFTPSAESVLITSTNWMLYPIGETQIPVSGLKWGGNIYLARAASSELQVWAERIEGVGELQMDNLVLVPRDHLVHVSGLSLPYSSPSNNLLDVYTHPNDVASAITLSPGVGGFYAPDNSLELSVKNWYFPVEPGPMVVAAQRENGQVLGDEVMVSLTCFPRYRSFAE